MPIHLHSAIASLVEIKMSTINNTKTSIDSKHGRSKVVIASVVMLTGINVYEVSLINMTTSVVDQSATTPYQECSANDTSTFQVFRSIPL